MGRFTSGSIIASDIAYAACSFGSVNGHFYRLLDKDFLPAKKIPNMTPASVPVSMGIYSSYGTTVPNGFGLSLNPMLALGGGMSGAQNGSSTSTYYEGMSQFASGMGGAEVGPSTAGAGKSNYTSRSGEFGHDHWELSKSGVISLSQRIPTYVTDTKTELNDAFVNGDLGDPSLALLMWKQNLYLVRRSEAMAVIVSNGARGYISKFAISGVTDSFYGNASYNRVRNELVIVGAASFSYSTVFSRIYSGLPDLTEASNINTILSAITPTQATIAWAGSYTPANDIEPIGGLTPILTDNGDLFLAFFNPGANMVVMKLPRATATTFGTMVNGLVATVTTSYGRGTSRGSGMAIMQSRDGNSVVAYSQYYYYGAGIIAFCVNKRTNSLKLLKNQSEGSYGYSVLHWGLSGFIVAQNYNSSYSAYGTNWAYDCSVQTASVSPTELVLPTTDSYFTASTAPFYIEVSQ